MGEIDDKYDALGGADGILGIPIGDEQDAANGGRKRYFQKRRDNGEVQHNGAIYWHPETGAFEVHGSIWEKYDDLGEESSLLGYPVSDESITIDRLGRNNQFQNGFIFFHEDLLNGNVSRLFAYEVISGNIAEILPQNSEILAVHAALLKNGKILYFSGSQHDRGNNSVANLDLDASRLWNPATNSIEYISSPNVDFFCSGHVFLADGKLLVTGGNEQDGYSLPDGPDPDSPNPHRNPPHNHFGGIRETFVFNPDAPDASSHWEQISDMISEPNLERNDGEIIQNSETPFLERGGGRWYPTLVTMDNGNVFNMSGHPLYSDRRFFVTGNHYNTSLEIYDVVSGTWSYQGEKLDAPDLYPRLHLLPTGEVFCSTPMGNGKNQKWNSTSKQWIDVADQPGANYDRDFKWTSVLLPLSPENNYETRILLTGKEDPRILNLREQGVSTSSSWSNTSPRNLPAVAGRHGENVRREHCSPVILPDGNILIIGGTPQEDFRPRQDTNALLAVEQYNPFLDTWSVVGSLTTPRVYHSTALLLPDGRIWISGSNYNCQMGMDKRELRIEIFSPPYLLSANPRPTIDSISSETIGYSENFEIDFSSADAISKVAIIRCSSITHGFNFDQRYVALEFSGDANALTCVSPPNGAIAPPGVYMLFIIDQNNIPSEGKFIAIE